MGVNIFPGVGGLLGLDLKAQVALRDAARTAVAAYLIGGDLEHFASTGRIDPLAFAKSLEPPLLDLLKSTSTDLGRNFFDILLGQSMGLVRGDFAGDAQAALNTVERAIGFGIDVHLGTGVAQGGLKALFGHSAPDGLFEAMRVLPEAVGMNFFLGTVLASIFERATGTPMAEAINEKVRPSRLEWPQIGRLLRQHDLTPAEADTYLKKAGFRDIDLPKLERLERSLLQVGDLQGLFEFGRYGDAQLIDGLNKLGYVGTDADDIKWLYANKAQTEGGRTYAAVARAEFVRSHISETEYRNILESVNTPTRSIEFLIDGAVLERNSGRTTLSRADIKRLRQEGLIDNTQAVKRLGDQGVSESDANLLLQEWDNEKKAGKVGLGTTRIIAYLNSGIIDAQKALALLVADGMRIEDATFLVAHPETHGTQYRYLTTPAVIKSAYLDDVLTYDEALQGLIDLNTDPKAAKLIMDSLATKKSRGRKPKAGTKTLSEALVLEGLKYGLVTEQWAITELETLGYTDADAHYIVALELTKLSGSGTPPDWWVQLS